MKKFELYRAKDENGQYTISFFKETLQSYLDRGGLISVIYAKYTEDGKRVDVTVKYKRKI